jgi:hypothetical protein
VYEYYTCPFIVEHAISADNFVVEDIEADRYLRPYNSASNRLRKVPGNSCIAGMDTNSDGSLIHTSPIGANTGVNVFIMDAGVRWYLRVDFVTRAVSLECQTELDNVSSALVPVLLAESNVTLLCLILAAQATGIRRKEFDFDIFTVSTSVL